MKTHFQNSVYVQAGLATLLGLTPAAVLAVFPICSGTFDQLVASSIDGEIQKGTHKKGIQVDINKYVPHYSVYPN